jgi:hypothetical protein
MSVLNAVIPNAIYSNQLGNGNQCAGGRFGGRSETGEYQ